jgi:hypothetical protein
MLRRFSRLVMTAFLAGNLLPLTAAQQLNNLDGRVFETATQRGIENLEVKLTPPTNSDLAVRLASTDQNGQFRFAQLRQGRYLLEVSQGRSLLYRAEINTEKQNHIDIPFNDVDELFPESSHDGHSL